MLAILLLLGADDLIATAQARLSAERPCVIDPDSSDITVCGLRHAERFRVSFVDHRVAHGDNVPAQRAALIHERTPMESMGPFLVGGGAVGVTASTGFGSGASRGTYAAGLRPPPP